jgi:hypothetical protein
VFPEQNRIQPEFRDFIGRKSKFHALTAGLYGVSAQLATGESNALSVEEQPPNNIEHEERHDQSRANNKKQETENCDDKYPVASSRFSGRGRVPAE